jgi:hypothetical protein
MSWETCYTGSNNIHVNKPPLMMDGRNYSSWQPEASINKKIQKKENIQTNWEYRQFLQNNGRSIMKYNSEEYSYYLGIDSKLTINEKEKNNGNKPFMFTHTHNEKMPAFGYSHSDLKTPYITREQLNARLISPSISNNLEDYGIHE